MTSSSCSLDSLSVLRISGPQGVDLLHAQLTQDFRHWPDDQARLAALLNPQGRMLADFIALREDAQHSLLLLDASIAAQTLQRLRMFVLRLQCTLEDATADWQRQGLLGSDAAAFDPRWAPPPQPWSVRRLAGGALLLRLPQADSSVRCLLLTAGADAAQMALHRDVAALPALTPAQWALQDIRAGLPHITAATQQAFVPQMINFELIGGVSFKKGCYPGQEVVARSQYRGTLKRRMYLVSCAAPMQPGQEVFHEADAQQPCGLVVNAAADASGRWWALAEIKIALAQPTGLHLQGAAGPALELGTLPYALSVPD
ncbi:folate-binding protein [Thiomonas sp.]|uniref:CAF17-like 4Fe-4S cluster assembly/insertion protein YgfZ n=1 Tax=Thiomonas sp. TaxID=2047785 RepID=UPI00262A38C6|nr:folate-binding protein [Thiomonas sp.]